MSYPPEGKSQNVSTRRHFLASSAAIAGAAAFPAASAASHQAAEPAAPPGSVSQLSSHLAVYHGPINVGIVRDGDQALVIDCGDGSFLPALEPLGIRRVTQLVFTHHHRDQALGAYALAENGAQVGVPSAERAWFESPQKYWRDDDRYLWNVYASFRPHRLMLVDPLKVDIAYEAGDTFDFGAARIRVLATPGHTEGSISYVVEVDGQRAVFSGDCFYDAGRLWDVYSMQQGFEQGGQRIGGYHGFMGDRWRLAESLERIRQEQPDVVVPSHGVLLRDAESAMVELQQRMEEAYENYVAISALRHYFPRLFTDYADRAGQMPIRGGIAPPSCLRHFGTTWMLVSQSGAGFVMDIGSPGIFQQLKRMLAEGVIRRVDGLWVTHYHFDHTAGIPDFQAEFDVPCIADRLLADVLTQPSAWRLPCLDPRPMPVHRPTEDGESWEWEEFRLTAYFLPGQTRYHGGLLAETGDLRMFFSGDSFTMAGIDDYCTYNRNWLGREVGFDYCLELMAKLQPTHIFNCHVNDAFTFTPEEIRFMRENLERRETLFGQLVPWDHANFGLDPTWVRALPYLQTVQAGTEVSVQAVVTNHAAQPRRAGCRACLPRTLGGLQTSWQQTEIAAKSEAALNLRWTVPADAAPGRHVVPIDVEFADRQLPGFAEAMLDVV